MDEDRLGLRMRAEGLLRNFEQRVPTELAETLRTVITGSPTLATQIESAVSRHFLRRVELLPAGRNALGEYHVGTQTIKIRPQVLVQPGMAEFVLGHEVQHALNGPVVLNAARRFHQEVARISARNADYTPAIRTLIQSSRWDESTAALAGWNALVDYVRATRRQPRLSDIVRAAPDAARDFIVGRGSRSRYFSSFQPDEDLSIPITPGNIEAIGRKYFDRSPQDSALGARGTSDYANYYATWAVSAIVSSHISRAGVRPMRIDLADLKLSRRIMEENGIDLHGIHQQAYVDGSSDPPTRDVFHHTMKTFSHVPPTAQGLRRAGWVMRPTSVERLPTWRRRRWNPVSSKGSAAAEKI